MFSLPTGFVSDIGTSATGVLSALGPYITLILGVLLGTLVLSILIGAIKK